MKDIESVVKYFPRMDFLDGKKYTQSFFNAKNFVSLFEGVFETFVETGKETNTTTADAVVSTGSEENQEPAALPKPAAVETISE